MSNLQLSLIEKWFRMTEEEIKLADYREITPHFCNKFLLQNGKTLPKEWWRKYLEAFKISELKNAIETGDKLHRITIKPFFNNIMTLGYPKATDTERILKLEHKGIEIGTGNPEWGAEEGKTYFIINHGKILK